MCVLDNGPKREELLCSVTFSSARAMSASEHGWPDNKTILLLCISQDTANSTEGNGTVCIFKAASVCNAALLKEDEYIILRRTL